MVQTIHQVINQDLQGYAIKKTVGRTKVDQQQEKGNYCRISPEACRKKWSNNECTYIVFIFVFETLFDLILVLLMSSTFYLWRFVRLFLSFTFFQFIKYHLFLLMVMGSCDIL